MVHEGTPVETQFWEVHKDDSDILEGDPSDVSLLSDDNVVGALPLILLDPSALMPLPIT